MEQDIIGINPELENLDIAAILRKKLESEYIWRPIEEYPELLALGPNMRAINQEKVKELAKSIAVLDQVQECSGDTLEDGSVRVIAGQHRYWAVRLLNELIEKHNAENPVENPEDEIEKIKLRVRVVDSQLTPYEMLDLQIAENLHEDLRPEEEAEKIAELFDFYRVVEGEKATVADFCRRVSRGETKVRNALKFVDLDKRVKKLVEEEAILYWVATRLSKVPDKRQFEVAMKIIFYSLEGEQVETFIRSILGEEDTPSLFSVAMREKLDGINHRLAFRTAADRAAKDASGYFKRVLRILDLVEAPERTSMTDTIRDILSRFVLSADEFRDELEIKAPHLWEIIKRRIDELKRSVKAKKNSNSN